MSLYNTISKRQLLLGEIEANDGELTDEMLEALAISDDRIQEGALELLGLLETARNNVIGAKTEKERLDAFIKSNEQATERLKALLLSATLRQGSIEAGSHRLTTRPSVAVVLSSDFEATKHTGKWVEPTLGHYTPDKTAIRKLLEAGKSVAGAELEQRTNLIIK